MSALALRTRELAFHYGRRKVLRSLNLEVPRGGVYGLLGRNAAGKTTTLRLLAGMLRPKGGSIELMGRKLPRVSPADRRDIGYVGQEPAFYPWMRVREVGKLVSAFHPNWSDERFGALLDRFRLESTQRCGTLSTGSKMKLAIALALAHRPPLLLMDEPTAGVDPVTRREIIDLVREVTRDHGHAALLSTHDLGELEAAADHVGLLHEGALLFQDTMPAIRARFLRLPAAPDGAQVLLEDERGVVIDAEQEGLPRPASARPASLEDLFFALTRTTHVDAA